MVLDTKRSLLYAVILKGISSSNDANIVVRLETEPDAPAPGRLGVIDLAYDGEMDRFYATNCYRGSCGLQVSEAEHSQELLYLAFDRRPTAMALSRDTHHLWVALGSDHSSHLDRQDAKIVAYDTRTWGQAAALAVNGPVDAMAVDARSNRIYLASGEAGVIYVVQDVATPQPAKPTETAYP